jgi:hypothetical protein
VAASLIYLQVDLGGLVLVDQVCLVGILAQSERGGRIGRRLGRLVCEVDDLFAILATAPNRDSRKEWTRLVAQ